MSIECSIVGFFYYGMILKCLFFNINCIIKISNMIKSRSISSKLKKKNPYICNYTKDA